MKRPDPVLLDNGDALSLAAFLLFLALVFATFPNPLPSPRGGEHAGLLGSGPVDGTAGRSGERVPFPKPTTLMVASWYGPGYAWKPTASGEIYDPTAFTYASRTDRFGRLIRVEVAGHSVVVRCNNRGPFITGRDIDLSQAAAEQLGIIERGVAIVSVHEVHP